VNPQDGFITLLVTLALRRGPDGDGGLPLPA
jgi:hypothetical protein